MPHLPYIILAFALGSCVGSFLNVVVWRLPNVELLENESLLHELFRKWQALSWPPSYCPKCKKSLKWYDNIPVIGWLKLAGKCRYCAQPISIRYPIVEAITGLLFVLYYAMFFMVGMGPCYEQVRADAIAHFFSAPLSLAEQWPTYLLDISLISALLAASLIDAELFIIPIEITWSIVPFALLKHAICDRPGVAGALNGSPAVAALAVGAGVGLVISLILRRFDILPRPFAEGDPLLEIDKAKLAAKSSPQEEKKENDDSEPREYSKSEIRAEMRKEMLFLFPPLICGFAWVAITMKVAAVQSVWNAAVVRHDWVSGLLGSVLGLLVGGFIVWITRILGSMAFGREAMGMGDVHLMAAVGAVLGGGPATVAFFLAPFFGMALAIYMLLTGTRRELPYGPYLSLATAFVMIFYCPIADYLSPGVTGLMQMISERLGG